MPCHTGHDSHTEALRAQLWQLYACVRGCFWCSQSPACRIQNVLEQTLQDTRACAPLRTVHGTQVPSTPTPSCAWSDDVAAARDALQDVQRV